MSLKLKMDRMFLLQITWFLEGLTTCIRRRRLNIMGLLQVEVASINQPQASYRTFRWREERISKSILWTVLEPCNKSCIRSVPLKILGPFMLTSRHRTINQIREETRCPICSKATRLNLISNSKMQRLPLLRRKASFLLTVESPPLTRWAQPSSTDMWQTSRITSVTLPTLSSRRIIAVQVSSQTAVIL